MASFSPAAMGTPDANTTPIWMTCLSGGAEESPYGCTELDCQWGDDGLGLCDAQFLHGPGITWAFPISPVLPSPFPPRGFG